METKHTPEPWQWTQTGVAAFAIIQPDGHSIVHCETLLNSTAQRLMEANARRIVACVNACEGMVDLNGKKVIDIIADSDESIKGISAQRDELAAALRDLLDVVVDSTNRGNGMAAAKARAVLAKLQS